MAQNPSNLPSRINRIYAFKDHDLSLKLSFQDGYDITGLTVKLYYKDKFHTGAAEITISGQLATVVLSKNDFLSINLPVFELFIYNNLGIAIIGATVEVSTKPGNPVLETFNISLIEGEVIGVEIVDTQASIDASQRAEQAAIQATQANKEAQAIVPTLQADISSRVPKATTVNGKALTTNISLNKLDIGIPNVDNTSDVNKPVSSPVRELFTPKFSNEAVAERVNDILYNILAQYTSEPTTYKKITTFADNTSMTDAKVDGVIYRKVGADYFKKSELGGVRPEWFNAKGDKITDDTVAIQKAIDLTSQFGGGTVYIDYRYKVKTLQLKKNVQLLGKGGFIGTSGFPIIQVFGVAASDVFNFDISGLSFSYAALEIGTTSLNNAIEIKNVRGGSISMCRFTNCNSGVNFVTMGVFQHSNRIQIHTNLGYTCNYYVLGIGMPDVDDAISKVFEVGDVSITNNIWNHPTYTHILLQGIDGLNLSDNYYFHTPTSLTKEYNVDLYYATRIYINNEHLFEAGYDSIRIGRFTNVIISNCEIAWPGQRVPGRGINFYNKAGRTELINNQTVVNNVVITYPTKDAIYVGDYLYGIKFTGIKVATVASGEKYIGTIPLNTVSHNTIYSEPTSQSISYEGEYDNESLYFASLNGKFSTIKESNVKHGSYSEILPTSVDQNTYLPLPYVENVLTRSNGYSFSPWTKSGLTVTEITNTDDPFGTGSIWRLIEDSINGQKALISSIITKNTTVEDFTLSLFAKADTRQYINLTLTNGSFASGIKIDFDILNGKTAWVDVQNTEYLLHYTRINKARNGFYRIEVSFRSPASATNFRYGIYIKNTINDKGNPNYLGNGSSLFIAHQQLIRGIGSAQYVESLATSISKYNFTTPLTVSSTELKTASGTGSNIINIAHGLSYTPIITSVIANNTVSNVNPLVTADATNFIFTFLVAPPTGNNNLSYNISYKR